MGNLELITTDYYYGFGTCVQLTSLGVTSEEKILANQAIFEGRVFEILGHDRTLEELKYVRGDFLTGSEQKENERIYYFKMEERRYKETSQDGVRAITKYKILELLK